ncbi:MAG TPA: DUF6325 family protein [Acidimicrobiales bacterium]|nr:DUF6325 family protein [Acidimicrobiales bacterium]
MTDEDDVFGPIDFVLIEFPGDRLTGRAGAALLDLVDAGTIRIWDVLVIAKDDDGSIRGIDLHDLSADHLGSFTAFAGARSGLLGDDDVTEAAGALEPGTVAALIVFENAWAVPFIRAARESGGQLVASARIPSDAVLEVLDALDAIN